MDQALRYTGLWDFGADLDMETMAQIKGLWVHRDRLSIRVGRISIGGEHGLEYDYLTMYISASDRGITLWSAFVFGGKANIVPIRYFWSGGMKWKGPFRRLREDVLALGFAAEFFSDALVDQTVETVLEGAYSFNVTTWLTVTPDVQYIIRPSGMKSIDNALLAGLLLYFTF